MQRLIRELCALDIPGDVTDKCSIWGIFGYMRTIVALCAFVGAVLPLTPALSAGTASGSTTVARYTFDGWSQGSTVVADDTGAGRGLTVLSRNGGTLGSVPHDGGTAIAFPGRCTTAGCPRAILEGGDDPRLDTGAANLSYGASVLLRPDQVADGENIMQKGVSRSSSMWKLQVDGAAGRPTCVLVGRGSTRHYIARSAVGVADGAWHRIACDRRNGRLTISVDGVHRGSVAVGSKVWLANDSPLRIGGKNVADSNDQYFGALDDVWVSRG
jgi:hypothetical protein